MKINWIKMATAFRKYENLKIRLDESYMCGNKILPKKYKKTKIF
jgi:hypothetical protein